MNALGPGPFSPTSYTVATAAGVPEKPVPPVAAARTMYTLTFHFDPPEDNGSAITGFRVR